MLVVLNYPNILKNLFLGFLLASVMTPNLRAQDKQEANFFKQINQPKPDKAARLLAKLHLNPKQRSSEFWLKKAQFYDRLSNNSLDAATQQSLQSLQDSALTSLGQGMYFYPDSLLAYQSQKALWLYPYWQQRADKQRKLLPFYSKFVGVIAPTTYYAPLHRFYLAAAVCGAISMGQIDADSAALLYSNLVYKTHRQGLDWQKYNIKADSMLAICFGFDCQYANNVVASRLNGPDSLISAKRILSIMSSKRCPYSLAYSRAIAIVSAREPSYGLCMQAGRQALVARLYVQAENYFASAYSLAGHPLKQNEALYWQAQSLLDQKKPWPALQLLSKIAESETADTKKQFVLAAQIWESKPIIPKPKTSPKLSKPTKPIAKPKSIPISVPDSLWWAWGALQSYKKAAEPLKIKQIENKIIPISKLSLYKLKNGQYIVVPDYPQIRVLVVGRVE